MIGVVLVSRIINYKTYQNMLENIELQKLNNPQCLKGAHFESSYNLLSFIC